MTSTHIPRSFTMMRKEGLKATEGSRKYFDLLSVREFLTNCGPLYLDTWVELKRIQGAIEKRTWRWAQWKAELKVQFAVIDSVHRCVVFPASLSSLNPSFASAHACTYVNEATERITSPMSPLSGDLILKERIFNVELCQFYLSEFTTSVFQKCRIAISKLSRCLLR